MSLSRGVWRVSSGERVRSHRNNAGHRDVRDVAIAVNRARRRDLRASPESVDEDTT